MKRMQTRLLSLKLCNCTDSEAATAIAVAAVFFATVGWAHLVGCRECLYPVGAVLSRYCCWLKMAFEKCRQNENVCTQLSKHFNFLFENKCAHNVETCEGVKGHIFTM